LTQAAPSGRATMVRWPFRTTTAPVSTAKARAVSSRRRWTSAVENAGQARHLSRMRRHHHGRGSAQGVGGARDPLRPGQGVEAVRIHDHRALVGAQGLADELAHRRLLAEAGPDDERVAFLASERPGSAASRSSEPEPVTGSGSVISSGRPGATRARAGAGVATVTSPAPDTSALVPERRAAPVLPTAPAATRTCPKVPLCADGARRG
jgi:hypothetical protein